MTGTLSLLPATLLATLQPLVPDRLAWPWLLAAIPLAWLAWRGLSPRNDSGPALITPWPARLQAARGEGRLAARRFPWLAALAWCLLCLAAARPQQLGPPLRPPADGRDLLLALDLSASMGEEDMVLGRQAVDRLTAAKAVLADFLQRRQGDRVGLLVFGDRAYQVAPLTRDLASVRAQLADAVPGLVGRATALGDAIGLATKRLQRQEGGERVLVLLTDGVNTAGVLTPDAAARIAGDAGVRIHAIAFGGDGPALSLFGLRLPMGAGDEIDEDGLRRIATMTGGRFFRARDADELAGIYAEIDRIEPIARPGPELRQWREVYPLPLAAALGIGVLALARRRRQA